MKKIIVLMLTAVTLIMLCSCGVKKGVTKSEIGVEITLDDSFYDYDSSGRYSYAVTDGNIIFGVNRVLFSSGKNINKLSTDDSASQRIEQENKKSVLRKDIEYNDELGYSYYEFLETEGNNVRVYFVYVYKTNEAFYFCDFSCLRDNVSNCENKIKELALTIKPSVGKFVLKVEEEKVFTSGIGISVTLNHSFSVVTNVKYAYSLSNKDVLFGVDRTLFSEQRDIDQLTTTGWATKLITDNNRQDFIIADVQYDEINNFAMYEYYEIENSQQKNYYSYIFKDNRAFYTCEFSCYQEVEEHYRALFGQWSKSILVAS